MSVASGPSIVTNGLILDYDSGNPRSYPGSGSTWRDVGPNSYIGTLINSPTYSNGIMTYTGSPTYADTGCDVSWNNVNYASWTVVLKPANLSQGNAGFLGKQYPDWEWAFYQNAADLSMVYWNTGGGHTNGMDWTASNFFTSTSSYVIFSYTWDGSTSKIYRNGALFSSAGSTDPSINQNRSNNVQMGGHIYVWGDYYWSGSMPYVNAYNRTLSAAEVLQNYEALRGRYGI